MARTQELFVLNLPVVGTAEVGALRSESDDVLLRHLHYPGGCFLTGDLPAIGTVPAKDHLLGHLGLQRCQVSGLNPFLFLRPWRPKEIDCRWNGQSCPN